MHEIYIVITMIIAILSLEWFNKVYNSSSIHSQSIAIIFRNTRKLTVANIRQAIAVIIHLVMEESPNSFPQRL